MAQGARFDHERWSRERSYWLREALANDPGEPCPPLAGHVEADVLIVGGGYTGMWTAHFLKEREPALDVVLLEQDICGGGPSGRNGGFVNDLAEEVETLLEVSGLEGAKAACEVSGQSVRELGIWCKEQGVDAWYESRPHVGVATSEAQDGDWQEWLGALDGLGLAS